MLGNFVYRIYIQAIFIFIWEHIDIFDLIWFPKVNFKSSVNMEMYPQLKYRVKIMLFIIKVISACDAWMHYFLSQAQLASSREELVMVLAAKGVFFDNLWGLSDSYK